MSAPVWHRCLSHRPDRRWDRGKHPTQLCEPSVPEKAGAKPPSPGGCGGRSPLPISGGAGGVAPCEEKEEVQPTPPRSQMRVNQPSGLWPLGHSLLVHSYQLYFLLWNIVRPLLDFPESFMGASSSPAFSEPGSRASATPAGGDGPSLVGWRGSYVTLEDPPPAAAAALNPPLAAPAVMAEPIRYDNSITGSPPSPWDRFPELVSTVRKRIRTSTTDHPAGGRSLANPCLDNSSTPSPSCKPPSAPMTRRPCHWPDDPHAPGGWCFGAIPITAKGVRHGHGPAGYTVRGGSHFTVYHGGCMHLVMVAAAPVAVECHAGRLDGNGGRGFLSSGILLLTTDSSQTDRGAVNRQADLTLELGAPHAPAAKCPGWTSCSIPCMTA